MRTCSSPLVPAVVVGCVLAVVPAVLCGEPNYDEAAVPAYELPDPLRRADGSVVADAAGWTGGRRAEVLRLFEEHVYGRSPGRPGGMRCELVASTSGALGGAAVRKQWRILLTGADDGPRLDLLVWLPPGAGKPVPAFLGLNFKGNHAVTDDPDVPLPVHGSAEPRGAEASRWPVATIVGRGYALATACYGDIEPDRPDGWKQGVRAALSPGGAATTFAGDDWGAIGAWAWGLSRALDCLGQDPAIDAKRVAVIGHSRLGKTALWAGARDERFALVISNNSGEGGAALARRRFGETTAVIQKSFPHWFCGNFRRYADREGELPVDQHELLALVAPRPLYVASAEQDQWADPRGEFLAAKAAGPVYALFGHAGVGVDDLPPPDHPVGGRIGYHIRRGQHDVTAYDWQQYLAFADRWWK